MKRFRLILTSTGGGLMIGGYNDPALGLHGMQARSLSESVLGEPLPLVPATALRGAMREALESILRGAGLGACTGGNGLTPEQTLAKDSARPCALDKDESGQPRACLACRLLGTQQERVPMGAQHFSGLLVSDAKLSVSSLKGEVPWVRRPGVGIQRNRRSAADQRLYVHEVIQSRDLEYHAELRLLDDTLEPALRAAVAGTTHMGAGRSRGLGRLELRLEPMTDGVQESATAEALQGGTLTVQLKLKSPAYIGEAITHPQLAESRHSIPGSTLRGAIGFALARQVSTAEEQQALTALVAEQGAQFGFLLPVDEGQAIHNHLPLNTMPLPITAAACKHKGRNHGVVDQLLDAIASKLVQNGDQALKARDNALRECRLCDQKYGPTVPLKSAKGIRGPAASVRLHTITRGAMDRMRASNRDEALFARRLLAENQCFRGTIRNIPPGSETLLLKGLASLDGIGRGISHGWGRVEASTHATEPLASISERADKFRTALSDHVTAIGLDGSGCDRLIPVTLLAPFIAEDPKDVSDDGEMAILSAIRVQVPDASCFLKLRRFEREGGWTQWQSSDGSGPKTGMSTMRSTSAGAVFIIEVPPATDWASVLSALETLERDGIGARTCQGFGHVITFDPFILNRTQREETPQMTAKTTDSLRPALVTAAENVIHNLFAMGSSKPKKTQLNQLINVCAAASCAEEIENYLRYQAGRGEKTTGMSHNFVSDAIDSFNATIKNHGQSSDTEQSKRVEHWRHYATFMTRAFTWKDAVDEHQSHKNDARSARGGR